MLGCSDRTFHIAGHHYALVHCTGLQPASTTPYEVRLDGERVWPQPATPYPPSVIRTLGGDGPFRIAWGSCRVTAPHEPPHSLTQGRAPRRPRGRRAARARRPHVQRRTRRTGRTRSSCSATRSTPTRSRPDVREYIRAQRDIEVPPEESVANFEEYTRLYHEAWSEPHIRWLLSTLPTAMIFDDHDVHDDWNTSQTWVDDIRAHGLVGRAHRRRLRDATGSTSTWATSRRITSRRTTLYARLREADDGWPILREFAFRADREVAGTRWSYCRDFGRTRLIMIDSRAGRVLDPPEQRSMLDPDEWAWLEEHAQGDFDHLLIGTSLPLLLAPGAALPGVLERGRLRRRLGQRCGAGRRADAPRRSTSSTGRRSAPRWTRVMKLVRTVGSGQDGRAAGIDRRAVGRRAPRLPGRGRLPARHRHALGRLPGDVLAVPQPARRARAARRSASPGRRAGLLVGKLLARSAGVSDPPVRWRFLHEEPGSTTRWPSSSSTAAARASGCRRPSPGRTRATPWRRSSSAGSRSGRMREQHLIRPSVELVGLGPTRSTVGCQNLLVARRRAPGLARPALRRRPVARRHPQ